MIPEFSDLLVHRMGTPKDYGFVIETWMRGYNHSQFARSMADQYPKSWARVAEGWLRQPDTKLSILANAKEPRMIIAFCVAQEPSEESVVLHWIYTQREWRRKGLAHELLKQYTTRLIYYTHRTNDVRIPPDWTYVSPIPPPLKS